MLSINTNLSSLIAQNSMKTSTDKLNQAIERMTTGAKINHAKDNAANYSISTNMTTKMGAYQVAEDNCSQCLDMLNTASESINLIEDKIQRLRALATQSSNNTYGTQSKHAINAEANAVVDEIERIYGNTEYNGVNIGKGRIICSEESKLLKDIERRNTSNMTTLESVDINKTLTSGTYSISTADELAKLATMVNNDKIAKCVEFVLADNIDLRHIANWTPIGNTSCRFNASFDGNGFTISNLTITSTNHNYNGLFGLTASDVTIKNLSVVNANITTSPDHSGNAIIVGGTATQNKLENLYASGTINSTKNYVGGIVGVVNSDTVIDSCSSVVEVTGTECAGGIAGVAQVNSVISNCVSRSNIIGLNRVGGIVGETARDNTITNCYSESVITSTSGSAGGIIGTIYSGIVENSYSNSQLISPVESVGGLVGRVYDGELKIINSAVLKDSSSLKGIFVGTINSSGTTGSLSLIDNSYSSAIVSTDKFLGNLSASNASRYSEVGTNTNCPSIASLGFNKTTFVRAYDKILNLQIGNNSDEFSQLSFEIAYSLGELSALRDIGNNSNDYLTQIDNIHKIILSKQLEYGTVQNRLESALEEIFIQYENLASSRSTIRDADIAEVSAEYIQQQILQQASATLMATANQSPSIALQLI